MNRRISLFVATLLAVCWLAIVPLAAGLEEEVGRSEVRIRSEAYPLTTGRTVAEARIPERLERLGYTRLRERPTEPGGWFWGHEGLWIYRKAHRLGGRDYAASLIGLRLRRKDGMILGALALDGSPRKLDDPLWLEPELLSESLEGDRAPRFPIELAELPEHVWRPLLAIEDSRFFDHRGVDARSVLRAALANLKAGGVSQGGSTLTQQLIKNRDLTPKRTMGRKLSEATRSLMLEAEYSKEEILQAYLNQVYLGHVDGLAIHGYGAGSRAYFSKSPAKLSLAEAATLAGMIQAPNRLTPVRHPEASRKRRNTVLARMGELGWASAAEVEKARNSAIRLKRSDPQPHGAEHFVQRIAFEVGEAARRRLEKGRGVVVETTLDPELQRLAEAAVSRRLAALRKGSRRLRNGKLAAALVAMDVESGALLAYVSGDPAVRGGFDRLRRAQRQPGSTVKPFLLLEAFDKCGDEKALNPGTRLLDGPIKIDIPGATWRPENYDREYRGPVTVRRALAGSINTPFVRLARHCGFEESAATLRKAGLAVPPETPPSFTLGAIEVSPLQLAEAFTVFATPGYTVESRSWSRIERPAGGSIARDRPDRRRVARPAVAYIVRDLLRHAAEEGTARAAEVKGLNIAAKTGTSSEKRDAWLAGHVGSMVVVAWVGMDDGEPLGLTGAQAAAPMWKSFVADAARARPSRPVERRRGVVRKFLDEESGLLVKAGEGEPVLFRRGKTPERKRLWRRRSDDPVID
ncbi:hypothetical protein ABI59_20595 [Acidobacteria bacterium Mor1]|nr:hypothetical protein ABI59_20595 [Acidobacteria bacterium Mor1]